MSDRKPPREPVEIASIGIPVLIEVVAVMLMIACGLLWMIILATPGVAQ